MISIRAITFIAVLTFPASTLAQEVEGTLPSPDADSAFVRTFVKGNDIRILYGGQANRLVLGSMRDGSSELTQNIYQNTNDYIGVGMTYKWFNGDLTFSLPGTTYLKEERSNLEQLKLSTAYTRRHVSYRAYFSNSKGMVVSGNENEYESTPTIHEVRMGLEANYLFNGTKYSYRAALYNSEAQTATAGSFMIRAEVFHRNLGNEGEAIVPELYDTESRFGEQVGLTYVRAPGLIIMPGYGANIVVDKKRFLISPMLLAGGGLAFNTFEGDNGRGTRPNMEYNLSGLLNAGYNGPSFYARASFMYSLRYSPINPAYLTSTNLTISLTVGLRFQDLKQ